jgi:hypothetical protein
LRVNGISVAAELNIGAFSAANNLTELRSMYKDDPAFRAKLDTISLWRDNPANLPDKLKDRVAKSAPDVLPESRGTVVTSLLQSPILVDGAETYGNVLKIPGFGYVFLAEYVLTEYGRRLNMLRFEVGSPADADIVAGGSEGGGSPYP